MGTAFRNWHFSQVFVRELISNASDALEKLRHLQLSGKEYTDKEDELEIDIYADEATNSLIIQVWGENETGRSCPIPIEKKPLLYS